MSLDLLNLPIKNHNPLKITDWTFFKTALLNWYQPDRRPMPWKEEKDPYLIWLSEIILQQTRVEQGRSYFERFKAAYPTVQALAAAPDDDVMKLWEGLGYYSRARNLLKAARMVVDRYEGAFPNTEAGLLSLPGVGPYTAAAIGSFAFDLPLPVLDGNVYRILARYTAEHTPIDSTQGKKQFMHLADLGFESTQAARFNQAIMDFGALVCTPKLAQCRSCPLASKCQALAKGEVYQLPVKAKKLKRRTRYFHFLVLTDKVGKTYIQKRTAKDIWRDLYQFPLIETDQNGQGLDTIVHSPDWPDWISPSSLELQSSSPPSKQQLTHQEIIGRFYECTVKATLTLPEGFVQLDRNALSAYAFPKLITSYLSEKTLYLNLF